MPVRARRAGSRAAALTVALTASLATVGVASAGSATAEVYCTYEVIVDRSTAS